MLSRYERIERKANVLKRLDPEREVELEDAFTNHLSDTIRASSSRECQQEIAKAIEVWATRQWYPSDGVSQGVNGSIHRGFIASG
jgi:hypothetical protein